jgi:YVTN family beta-propeller protein
MRALWRSVLFPGSFLKEEDSMRRLLAFAALSLAVLPMPGTAQAADNAAGPTYSVVKSVPLGAPDRWDYLTFDPASHRVYISHGDRISVVDGESGRMIGTVSGMKGGTHGIAIFHDAGIGYTDDGEAGEAVAFDLETLKPLKRLKAEDDADGIVSDPTSGHAFVIDGDSGKLTVVDPKTDSVVATIDAGGGVEFGASGANGKFYVNGADRNEIVRIDTRTNMVDAHWPMTACKGPHGLAIDRAHHRLFSTCSNKVMVVMDSDTGRIVTTLPVGEFSDAAVFDPVHSLVFSSNSDGTITVVSERSPDDFVELSPIKTPIGARTMAEDPETGRIYTVAGDMTADPSAKTTNVRGRYRMTPGSAKLLFLDPSGH